MPKFDISAEEKRQIQKNAAVGGFSVIDLPSAENQAFTWYNDPRREREMYLPCDPINQRTYLNKGYRMGHQPNCEHAMASEQALTEAPLGNALPTNVQELIDKAVQAALQAAGVLPEPPVEPKQLEFQF
jgi:hypothetical protein